MRITEFKEPGSDEGIRVANFIAELRKHHQLVQFGGIKRVYKIGNTGKLGVIFFLDDSPKAVGIAWDRGQKFVSTVYVWKVLDPDREPDIAVDVPVDAEVAKLVAKLQEVIAIPKTGIVEATAPVQPIKPGDTIKVGERPDGTAKEVDDITRALIQKGQAVLLARKASGEYFFVPNMEAHLRKLDAMLNHQITRASGGQTMEEQYQELEDQVRMVASGNTKFVKSTIIIGAPSSGKSFRVMRVLKELGLHQGRDYVFKTGSVSDAALYRLLIEQINGMIVFDDCDTVWDSQKAANYMKGALNTGDIRSINNDTARTTGIAVLEPDERMRWLKSASRVLRNKPVAGDLERVYPPMATATDHSDEAYSQYIADAQKKLRLSPPDQIDFGGRIIFISNLERDQLDPAVVSRSNVVELKFGDAEMLDFMEQIGDKIEGSVSGGTQLGSAEIEEVFTHIRFQSQGQGFKSPLNFRFVQKAFDYRRSNPNWKRLVSAM